MIKAITKHQTYSITDADGKEVFLTRDDLEALYQEMREILIYGEE
jgi:hypothetical protein